MYVCFRLIGNSVHDDAAIRSRCCILARVRLLRGEYRVWRSVFESRPIIITIDAARIRITIQSSRRKRCVHRYFEIITPNSRYEWTRSTTCIIIIIVVVLYYYYTYIDARARVAQVILYTADGRNRDAIAIALYILRWERIIHRVKADDLYVWQDYMHGDGGGGRCVFSVYLGMECRRAVGLFLPGIKKKKKKKEWKIERERRAHVSLATGNFLLEPEWRTGVWLPNKSVARKNSSDRAKNKTISY